MTKPQDFFSSKKWKTLQDELIKKLLAEIDTTKISILKAQEVFNKNDDAYDFVNSMPFIRLAFTDITILFRHFKNAKSDWETKLFARLLCLSIYELFEDINSVLGKKFRQKLSDWPNSDELLIDLNKLIKEFNSIKKLSNDYVKSIRNFTIAHRDKNAVQQLLMIESLDLNLIEMTTINIHQWYVDYQDFEFKMITATLPYYKGELENVKID